jgi:hypothetical protein
MDAAAPLSLPRAPMLLPRSSLPYAPMTMPLSPLARAPMPVSCSPLSPTVLASSLNLSPMPQRSWCRRLSPKPQTLERSVWSGNALVLLSVCLSVVFII